MTLLIQDRNRNKFFKLYNVKLVDSYIDKNWDLLRHCVYFKGRGSIEFYDIYYQILDYIE